MDGEKDTIELSSAGTVEINEKGLRLSYAEPNAEGEMSQTVLTLIGETVKIDRDGGSEMSMIVQKGKHRKCSLVTPMGVMLLGTYGTHLAKGSNFLSVRYDLDVNAVLMSKNELEIKYILD